MVVKKSKGLGKGLNSIFGVKSVADVLTPQSTNEKTPRLSIEKLKVGKYQARVDMPEDGIQELAASIRENGILNPIVVRPDGDFYEILAGERRFRAAKLLGLDSVPVTILSVNDKEALTIGLIENLQREDLNVMEASLGLNRLCEEFNYTHEEVAKAIGRSRSTVTNLLRLLVLPEAVQQKIREGRLEMGHARALLPLSSDKQIELAELIDAKGLSVRQVEALVAKEKQQNKKEPKVAKSMNILHYEDALSSKLGVSVKLTTNTKGSGKIHITFTNQQEFENILAKLDVSK